MIEPQSPLWSIVMKFRKYSKVLTFPFLRNPLALVIPALVIQASAAIQYTVQLSTVQYRIASNSAGVDHI